MMNENTNCPNCQAELKEGFLSSVKLLSVKQKSMIKEYSDIESDTYCTKCGKELHNKCIKLLIDEKIKLTGKIEQLIKSLPVISTHTPLNWDYSVLDMVTGQSTTGTGVVSEFTSSFTDLFGVQSGQHNKKLKIGEELCFAQLRKQTLDKGGNAVIAADIDYSELGASKGMIMVCMAGTAVKLNNPEILGDKKAKQIEELISVNDRLEHLGQYVIWNI